MKRQEMLLAARDNAEIARDTRWMLPSLNRLGYNEMTLLVEQIGEELDNIHYFVENGDETFTNAMDSADSDGEDYVPRTGIGIGGHSRNVPRVRRLEQRRKRVR